MTNLPKTYDPQATEERLYRWWENKGFFTPTIDWDEEPFVISMPPPNVTGGLHMGHAMFVTLEDIMTRYHRMKGEPTLWLPGTDHAGIATQLLVERMIWEQEGKRRQEVGREEFVARVWEWKERYGGYITRQLRRLGASCDWTRERFTLDPLLSRAVVEVFVRLYEKGLIYRGTYLINWSPNLQTAVSDLEVEYSTEPGTLYFFKYRLADNPNEYIPVATTRPETILGDTAVAVHPADERYQRFIGRTALVPILDRSVPVIPDEYVEREFGTGALKITPGHDPNDYEIGQRHNLPIINIMNKDATLNENGGPYAGRDRFEARKRLWADMEAAGLTLKTQPHELNVPRSQRGGEIIEPLVSTQWFVKIGPLAEPAIAAVREGCIEIIPERFEKVYFNWMENIRDWCISRQLWWGHRIPVWYTPEGDSIVARSEEEAHQKARERYGNDLHLEQDSDVLDTWFSSGLWPFSTLGWPDETEDLRYFYPTTVMETGYDILFFWVARMIMMGLEMTGEVPFYTVYLHGLVRDAEGRKMSKTLGNVIDPLEVIEEYGTDALRFTLVTGTTPGQDINLAVERIEANRNFANKIWNAARFVLANVKEAADISSGASLDETTFEGLPLVERWIVSRHNQLVADVTDFMERHMFGEAGRALYSFLWSEFADWYIETGKTRLYAGTEEEANTARLVLLHVLERTLRLLHPFMPFVTEEIWQHLPHTEKAPEALIVAPWPVPGPVDEKAIETFEQVQDLIRAVRNARNSYDVEPGRRIAATIVAPRAAGTVAAERPVITALARIADEGLTITDQLEQPPAQAVHLVVGDGLEAYLPLAGLVDLEKERERLAGQVAETRDEIARVEARLSNPGFVNKAPAQIVQGARDQVAAAQQRLTKLEERLAMLVD
ncbi:MAG: valine--tRNA ligase [Ardenticatenaceae bacterium]|nr:valine--tRNA ligase [Ardenticatenaceae bacterium]